MSEEENLSPLINKYHFYKSNLRLRSINICLGTFEKTKQLKVGIYFKEQIDYSIAKILILRPILFEYLTMIEEKVLRKSPAPLKETLPSLFLQLKKYLNNKFNYGIEKLESKFHRKIDNIIFKMGEEEFISQIASEILFLNQHKRYFSIFDHKKDHEAKEVIKAKLKCENIWKCYKD